MWNVTFFGLCQLVWQLSCSDHGPDVPFFCPILLGLGSLMAVYVNAPVANDTMIALLSRGWSFLSCEQFYFCYIWPVFIIFDTRRNLDNSEFELENSLQLYVVRYSITLKEFGDDSYILMKPWSCWFATVARLWSKSFPSPCLFSYPSFFG